MVAVITISINSHYYDIVIITQDKTTVLLQLSPLLFLSAFSKGTRKSVHLLDANHRETSEPVFCWAHGEKWNSPYPLSSVGLPCNPFGLAGGWHACTGRAGVGHALGRAT